MKTKTMRTIREIKQGKHRGKFECVMTQVLFLENLSGGTVPYMIDSVSGRWDRLNDALDYLEFAQSEDSRMDAINASMDEINSILRKD